MNKAFALVFTFALVSVSLAQAQYDFYDTEAVREIRITFTEKGWRHILDSLFQYAGDEGRLTGTVTIDGSVLHQVGIRYKGYSSYNPDVVKNPFNLDLDYHLKNQNYQGFTKIKLSNVIHDPSFVREVLAYEIAGTYLPSPRANYANLFINDTLIGLYTNVEAITRTFSETHFGTSDATLIKGEPAKLQYPFGENANLAYTHGDDSAGYQPFYKIESEYGWSDFFNLIRSLDSSGGSVARALDIDRALWMHAFNFVFLNLDSYIGYAQNYYLCQDMNGVFNPVLWDLNMSFGSFRESDGSYHFQGLSIPQLKILDPLEHLSFAVSPRPLMTSLFSNDTLRKMYLAHMRTMLNEQVRNNRYFERGRELQNLIAEHVYNDPNKFYSDSDFVSNLTVTVGGTGSMIEYPGIKDLMQARLNYLDTVEGFSGEPVITEVTHTPENPVKGKSVWIHANLTMAAMSFVGYREKTGAIFEKIPFFDDGQHQDGDPYDGLYGTEIPVRGNIIEFYIYAENDSAGAFSPERAAYEYYTIYPIPEAGIFTINEIKCVPSDQGDSGGWVELVNTIDEPVSLAGLHLTDDLSDPLKWAFPDTLIQPKTYLILRPSDESALGLQINFSLPASGGSLFMSNSLQQVIDSVTYGQQIKEKSIGRFPNGYGSYTFMAPTFSRLNQVGTTPSINFLAFPNPAYNLINIELYNMKALYSIEIFNEFGQKVFSMQRHITGETIPVSMESVDVSNYRRGIYLIKVTNGCQSSLKKIILI